MGKNLPTLEFYIDTGEPVQKLKYKNTGCYLKFYKRKIDSVFSKLLSARICGRKI